MLNVLMDEIGDFGSSSDFAHESCSALLLGLQPLVSAIYCRPPSFASFYKFFHLLLDLVKEQDVAIDEKKAWNKGNTWSNSIVCPLYKWNNNYWMAYQAMPVGGVGTNDDKKAAFPINTPKVLSSFTLCGNLQHYRVLLYTGTRLYNDNGYYFELLGLLVELFFRSAFGDEVFLTLLYDRLTKKISDAAAWCIEPEKKHETAVVGSAWNTLLQEPKTFNPIPAFAMPQVWSTWQEFNDARTGPGKDSLTAEQKASYPPIVPTFQEFLKRTFGLDTWQWDDANKDKPLTFDNTKKDAMLAHFLKTVHKGEKVAGNELTQLEQALAALKARLVVLAVALHKLNGSVGV